MNNYLIKLTGYNFLLYFFFLKKKAEIYPKEKVLANLVFGNFKYHEGYYKYLEGDLNYQHCYDLASNYYDGASRILGDIMKKEYISNSNIENFDIRFINYVFLIMVILLLLNYLFLPIYTLYYISSLVLEYFYYYNYYNCCYYLIILN